MNYQTTIRTYNGKRGWDSYLNRVHGAADIFFTDFHRYIGLIAMQEVKETKRNWLYQITQPHGAHILRDRLINIYSNPATAADYKSLGIVAGGEFTINDTSKKYLGKDSMRHFGNRSKRRLLGIQLSHLDLNNRFWFYTTHLSHGNRRSDMNRRVKQIDKIIKKIKTDVNSDELPPIIAGDFNIIDNRDEAGFNKLRDHFLLIFANGIDQIWIGRHEIFNCKEPNYHLLESTIVNLVDQRLSDHNSPRVRVSYGDPTKLFRPPWLIPS